MPTRRRNVLIGVAAGAVLLVAIAASVGAIHGRRGPFHAAAKQALPVVTTTTDPTVGTAACTTVLPVATAMQLTGAANMQVVSFNQSWTHFPANPNADCHYNASAPRDAFPDASKSVVLWLWINQAHASQIYSDLVAGWPYAGYVPTATPISGIGLRAANNHGALIVQANINDVFYLAVGTGSGVPISEAETIVAELTPPPAPPAPSSSTTGTTHPSTGTSKKTTTTPPATAVRAATARPPSTTTSPTSGTTTSGTTTTAPPSTTTAPPTTTSGPTTTTSVPPPTTTTAPPTTTTTAPLPPVITDPTLPPLPPPVGIPIADPPAGHGGGHGHGDGGGGGNGHGHGGGGGDGHVSEQ